MLDVTSHSPRILIVDDDPAILGLVRAKLGGAGLDVLTAACGDEALELIHEQGLPHLAIVDINMPGIDVFQFCRQVQAYCALPVILLTAVGEEETIIRGIERYAMAWASLLRIKTSWSFGFPRRQRGASQGERVWTGPVYGPFVGGAAWGAGVGRKRAWPAQHLFRDLPYRQLTSDRPAFPPGMLAYRRYSVYYRAPCGQGAIVLLEPRYLTFCPNTV